MINLIGLKKIEARVLDKQFENIVLDKEWRVLQEIIFKKYDTFEHQDSCIHWELLDSDKSIFDDDGDEICNCIQFPVEKIIARMAVYGYENNQPGPYFQVTILERPEDFKSEEEYLNPEKYSQIIKEDIANAYLTMYVMLRAYEITGNEKMEFFDADRIVMNEYNNKLRELVNV